MWCLITTVHTYIRQHYTYTGIISIKFRRQIGSSISRHTLRHFDNYRHNISCAYCAVNTQFTVNNLTSVLPSITLKPVILYQEFIMWKELYSEYCRSAMSESSERVCQFVLDMIRCWDWYSSHKCIIDRDEICQIIKFLAAG